MKREVEIIPKSNSLTQALKWVLCIQFSFRTLISMTNWIQFGISFCLTLTLILVETTCFHFQSTLRKLYLNNRKGFWEVGGLNAFCVLSPSDSNLFTSLEPSSFWGQKACRMRAEVGSIGVLVEMWWKILSPVHPLKAWRTMKEKPYMNVAIPGKSSVCKNLPLSQIYVIKC